MVTVEPRVGDNERLCLDQVHALLDVSKRTIYNWIKNGDIRPIGRRCGHLLFSGREVKRVWRGDF